MPSLSTTPQSPRLLTFLTLLPITILLTLLTSPTTALSPSSQKILLSKVSTLTLHANKMTSHRRVSPISQLTCTPPPLCALASSPPIQSMRCTNAGSSYSKEDIEWTCAASLPPEFKLGSTDVICEGYESPEDPWILKGSCGVEYTLVLTEEGERKFGERLKRERGWGWGNGNEKDKGRGGGSWGESGYEKGRGKETRAEKIAGYIFWALFWGVVGWMVYSAFFRRGEARGERVVGGYGGGGGGGPGGDDSPPPPPPYSRYDDSWRGSGSGGSSGWGKQGSSTMDAGQGAWNPGFWTGALGGAAAGYAANAWRNVGSGTGNSRQQGNRWGGGGGGGYDNGGEGSSRSGGSSFGGGSGGGGGSGISSSRHESTGFGGTSRR